MRYQVKRWAAVDFLLSSKKRSQSINKLRHFLILLFRTLMLLCFIFALARPIVGGWIGGLFSGSADNVIIVFDRSASMGAKLNEGGLSKFDKSVKAIVQLAKQYRDSRFILLDSATNEIKPLKDVSYLENKKSFTVTQTYAPLPKLVEKAVSFYKDNDLSKTEIWVVSDYQKSNWNENSPRWKSLAKFNDQKLSFRFLLSSSTSKSNIAVRVLEATPLQEKGRYYLNLRCQLLQNQQSFKSLVISFVINDSVSKSSINMQSKSLEFSHKVEITKEDFKSGFGYVQLPFDNCEDDNRYYFAYAKTIPYNVAVISIDQRRASLLKILVSPYENNTLYKVKSYESLVSISNNLDKLTMLIIDGISSFTQYKEELLQYVKRGGYILVMPPQNKGDFLGVLKFDAVQDFGEQGIRVEFWEKNFGPFAKSSFGKVLALDKLNIRQRQTAQGGISLAQYEDGKSFINRYLYGFGSLYYCSTSISSDWSNLDQGTVILPMLHRMMKKANERFSSIKIDFLGSSLTGRKLQPILIEKNKGNFLIDSGVYTDDKYTYCLNRPPLEDDFSVLDEDAINNLFSSLNVLSFFKEQENNKEQDSSEVSSLWTLFVSLILVFMILEALLTLGFLNKSKRVQV